MKLLTFPAILAAIVFSAVLSVPFLAGVKPVNSGRYALEVRMTSTRPGFVQVYYRPVGGGLSETASSKLPLVQSSSALTYRLPLPAGQFEELRFDPLTRPGSVTIESMRVVDRSDRTLRTLALSSLKPVQQIASLVEQSGRLDIVTTPEGDDPQLTFPLQPILDLPASWFDDFSRTWRLPLTLFLGLLALLLAADRRPGARAAIASRLRRFSARPGSAVTLCAAVAVLVSAYPVVFLGKSHVSPNYFPPLLYDDIPTLPDATATTIITGRGADLGAMMWQHLPYSTVQHRAVTGFELPLWNRYNSIGTPLLGQGQSMFGDPLHVPVMLARGAAWAWDLKYLAAKWLFALGLGLIVLRVTNHLPAALVVAFAAPFIGFFVYRINHPAYFSLCYAPWPLYGWLRVTQAADWRTAGRWAAGVLAANLALMNSGTVKEAYMLLLAMNFSGACLLTGSVLPWRMKFGRFAMLGWSGVLLVLLTTPIWATFLHTLKNAQTNYDLSAVYQIQPSLLLGAFDEAFFRLIMPDEFVFNPSLNFLLLLGLLYFLATLRFETGNRPAIALALSALPPFALTFGVIPPAWLASIPFIGRVQHIDNSFLCVLIVLWSVLAGVGFARAATRLGTPDGRTDLKRVAWWMLGLVGLWIAFRQTVHRGAFGPGMTFSVLQNGQVLPVSPFIWGYLGSLLAASVVLAFVVRRSLHARKLTAASTLMIALCVGVLLWRHGLHAETVGFKNHVVRPPARSDLQAESPAMQFLRTAQEREPSRGFGLRNNFFMGWTGVYGLEAINGPDGLMNPWYRELLAVSGAQRGISWDFVLPPENVAEVRRFFDALNVRYYLSRGRDDAVLRRALTSVEIFDLDIWESPTAWPRAFFTDHLAVYDQPAELMQQIKSGDDRPFAAVHRSELAKLPVFPRSRAERTVTPATSYRLTANTTGFDVKASAPGVIVLSEAFWPGDFRVELNGKKAPVLRLNHAFKGVAVSAPGDYHVVFRYVPRSFPRNLLLSASGAILILVSLILLRRRRLTAAAAA